MVKTLHSRAGAICSHATAKDQKTWHIRQALISNGYPKRVLQHHGTPAHPRLTDDQNRGLGVTLPYVHGLSEAVWRILALLGVRVTSRPNTTLRQLLVRPKNHVPKEELACVPDPMCCLLCHFVGQTDRCLGKRVKEHRKAVESGDCANSALAEHA